jgi:ribonuclease Z
LHIRKDRLEKMDCSPGSWLKKLKKCIYEDKPDEYLFQIPAGKNRSQKIPLGELKKELVLVSPGQKISYIVDTVYNEANKNRIVDLVRNSDIFFCESPFLAEEEARGLERYHLTSCQAGIIAREADVKKLNVFHFSGRHTFNTAQLIQEAEESFRKK